MCGFSCECVCVNSILLIPRSLKTRPICWRCHISSLHWNCNWNWDRNARWNQTWNNSTDYSMVKLCGLIFVVELWFQSWAEKNHSGSVFHCGAYLPVVPFDEFGRPNGTDVFVLNEYKPPADEVWGHGLLGECLEVLYALAEFGPLTKPRESYAAAAAAANDEADTLGPGVNGPLRTDIWHWYGDGEIKSRFSCWDCCEFDCIKHCCEADVLKKMKIDFC